MTETGRAQIADAFDNAETVPPLGAGGEAARDDAGRDEPPPFDQGQEPDERPHDEPPYDDGGHGAGTTDDEYFWPELCPVIPLGKGPNGEMYCLDELGMLRTITAKTISKRQLEELFGRRSGLLDDLFPKVHNRNQNKIVWDQDWAMRSFMKACAEKGPWDPRDRIRGRGCWDDDGALVYHTGTRIYRGGQMAGQPFETHKPGLVEGYVYPHAEAIPAPAVSPQSTWPGRRLLARIKTWHWQEEEDAYLFLGLIIVLMIGGALTWRPVGWLQGKRGCGKSTLFKIAQLINGGSRGLLVPTNATGAGVWSTLERDSVGVVLDEAEPDANAIKKLTDLAKDAAGGGEIIRGTQDHKAVSIKVVSGFLFGSILMPGDLGDAFISRIALFKLRPFKAGAKRYTLTDAEKARWMRLGCQLRGRVMQQWYRWGETFRVYADALAAQGHEGRSQMVYGALCAAADLVLSDHVPEETDAAALTARISPAQRAVERESDEMQCLAHLLTSVPQMWGRGASTIGDKIEIALGLDPATQEARDRGMMGEDADAIDRKIAAKKHLRQVGIVIHDEVTEARVRQWVGVANAHAQLNEVYFGKRWADGAWAQETALKALPGAVWGKNSPKKDRRAETGMALVKLSGRAVRMTWLPDDLFV